MLSKCVNPVCSSAFLYFHQGKLYLRNPKAHLGKSNTLEYFWLCSMCCRTMTIQINDSCGVAVISKQAAQDSCGSDS